MPLIVDQRDVELPNSKVVLATMNPVETTGERKTKEMLMKDQVSQA